MEKKSVEHDLERLKASLETLPEPIANPGFVVVSGLPGTGKTFFCKKLTEQYPLYVIESDALRKVLFRRPDYSASESTRLFSAIHRLLEWLLKRGTPVCFDATNLTEHHREHLYRISDRTGARLILISVEAPMELAYERLKARKSDTAPETKSDADWEIYRQMKPMVEKIRRHHYVVDTSRDISPVVNKIVRALNRKYW